MNCNILLNIFGLCFIAHTYTNRHTISSTHDTNTGKSQLHFPGQPLLSRAQHHDEIFFFFKKKDYRTSRGITNFTRFCCEGSAVCVDILPHIILLRQVEQLTNLGCSLGTSHPWLLNVCQTWQVIFTLLHNHQVQNREIWTHNAPTNRLSPTLSITPSITTEARGSCSSKHYKKDYSFNM